MLWQKAADVDADVDVEWLCREQRDRFSERDERRRRPVVEPLQPAAPSSTDRLAAAGTTAVGPDAMRAIGDSEPNDEVVSSWPMRVAGVESSARRVHRTGDSDRLNE